MALHCFKTALLDPQANGDFEDLNGYLEKCKKLEFQSRTGAFDLSDWILGDFRGDSPELAEYIGALQIERSEISGRGLFATKNIDAGTLILVTKAIATQRSILPAKDSGENAQMIMWRSLIDEVVDSTTKCQKTRELISILSTGEDEDALPVPDISLFRPESEMRSSSYEKLDTNRILSILDVNSLVEEAVSAKVMGKNSEYYGVGLWVLTSFINHSCHPNSRRLHVNDHVILHASRDIKAGEEITLAYFDVLSQLGKRKEMSKKWGFVCKCKRCKVEEGAYCEQEMREIEVSLERGVDVGGAIFRLEEGMRKRVVRGKERGYLRASFWGTYSEVYSTERLMRRWGRRIPAIESVVDSVVDAVGSDERILKIVMEGLKKNGGVGSGSSSSFLDMERAMKLGRGVYGKIAKKKAMRYLLGFD
ncbi:LOW QUALITY PROTEIN: uncharacterized protein LOC110823968 [Carica papaya]|uniref:LOW QUALITY PROTEIN: uncharacterized protein LOC110823968 n=1 Tax=Carica papaya TaxID=3649 RepID=UPI000B8CFF3D|nr:LOW QUALITY PROTEIN: uncharacterized protein LOC110823968 [Carica papaya]